MNLYPVVDPRGHQFCRRHRGHRRNALWALIIAVLNNGLTLMNVSYYWQLVIKGAAIVTAVGLDRIRMSKAV